MHFREGVFGRRGASSSTRRCRRRWRGTRPSPRGDARATTTSRGRRAIKCGTRSAAVLHRDLSLTYFHCETLGCPSPSGRPAGSTTPDPAMRRIELVGWKVIGFINIPAATPLQALRRAALRVTARTWHGAAAPTPSGTCEHPLSLSVSDVSIELIVNAHLAGDGEKPSLGGVREMLRERASASTSCKRCGRDAHLVDAEQPQMRGSTSQESSDAAYWRNPHRVQARATLKPRIVNRQCGCEGAAPPSVDAEAARRARGGQVGSRCRWQSERADGQSWKLKPLPICAAMLRGA